MLGSASPVWTDAPRSNAGCFASAYLCEWLQRKPTLVELSSPRLFVDTPVSGTPRLLLRMEVFVVLIAAIIGYRAIGGSWLLFALALLLPDLALAAYAAGPRLGAAVYNAFHSYVAPGALAAIAFFTSSTTLWALCLIWVAHIGMDRALGLGLKFSSAFGDTHLGTIGRVAPTV
jgi:hypothetical protein